MLAVRGRGRGRGGLRAPAGRAAAHGTRQARPGAPAMAADGGVGAAFLHIIGRGGKSNTYKFALARCLLEYSAGPAGELEVPYADIASAFPRYCWHQECMFKIRQSFNADRPPHAIQAIREEFGTGYIPRTLGSVVAEPGGAAKARRAEGAILRRVLGTGSHSNVIPRFQNVRDGQRVASRPLFYEHDDAEQVLRLRPEAAAFLRDNQFVLTKAVVLEWSKFLERINTLPRLVAKVERGERRRGSLRRYTKMFKDTGHCFYCSSRLEAGDTHVDHFIPWSYIYEDEAWNLVLSCGACNSRKSDSLARESYLDDLIRRNCGMYDRLPPVQRSLDRLDAGKGWEAEVRHSYQNCREYGFGVTCRV